MKRIINNKRYNTDTAKKCGKYERTRCSCDWLRETLYLKRNIEFFLYREVCYPDLQVTEKIIPMSYKEAQEWAKEHLKADEYESAFGSTSENKEVITTSISMTASDLQAIKRNAAQAGMTVSAYIVSKCV